MTMPTCNVFFAADVQAHIVGVAVAKLSGKPMYSSDFYDGVIETVKALVLTFGLDWSTVRRLINEAGVRNLGVVFVEEGQRPM